MVQVFLSINNNEEVIQLPVPPADYNVPSPWKNEQMSGLQGPLNLIGLRGLRSIEIQSFFPAIGHDYPFLQSRELWGMAYVETIERWRDRRLPVRLVISNTNGQSLNMAVTIDDFDHGMKKDGDIYYTLKMTEFTFITM
ncbi:hypothetical protein ACHHV8_36665 [Paenibacillus sp. TAB 01]|uniref:hypothetical protein n=1 Tax=Paenibacillus sp. TAB 01 TaxID=3368988 RepID=UPI003751E768